MLGICWWSMLQLADVEMRSIQVRDGEQANLNATSCLPSGGIATTVRLAHVHQDFAQ